mmetsp:Transcript_30451/g.79791  ORF Transcript_30451/g.79791 Transcript_30451/m.79791 type:complete len:159 (+) Transcript_30451:218-694(+)
MATKIMGEMQCLCGSVVMSVDADRRFSILCHCKPCTRARGTAPVHLLGVAPPEAVRITKGAHLIKINKDPAGGKMEFAFCSDCGGGVYQSPAGASFRALYPANFHFEDGESLQTLPDEFLPTAHYNYDNRCRPFRDGLPKKYPGNISVDDDGNPLEAV